MHKKRSRFVFSIALMLALLIGTLPVTFSTAMENTQAGDLQCPPMDASLAENPAFRRLLPPHCRGMRTSPQSSSAQSLVSPLATGGPDGFGYTYDDTVPVNWISPSAPGLTGDEGYIGPYGLSFPFPFYGSDLYQFYINFNGLLTINQGDCCTWGGTPIPSTALPNNLIAPFWEDLAIGPPYNSGGLFYGTGGVAPDRYFVAEWRDVTTYAGSDPFSFEVILYENGDIIFQYESLPASYFSTVGIEDGTGYDGLQYQSGTTGLSAPKAIKFTYPTGPIPRVSVSPLNAGKFAATGANTNFPVTIQNTGSAGTDTYNLSMTSSWTAALYRDGCVMPLTDTNADTVVDTGPLPEGASMTICVSFTAPPGVSVGDGNSVNLIVSSSLDPTRTRDVSLDMAVSASFVQVLEDYENAAMAFQIHGPDGSSTNYVTNDSYFANGLAMMRLEDGRYIYAWRKPDGNFPNSHSNIEFMFLNADGSFSLPVTQLTNNSGTGQTYDYDPAVAVDSSGSIGVTWRRWIVDNNTGQSNYNMFFAMISQTGTVFYGPINITNNNLWDNFDNYDVPHFFEPAIAVTDDDRFVVGWQEYRTNGSSINHSNIWYAVRGYDGSQVLAPNALTNNNFSFDPILNPLTDGKVILTFVASDPAFGPYFAVIRSDGTIAKPVTPLDNAGNFSPWSSPDAVVLSNGTVAVAWPVDAGVALGILDGSSYDVTSGPIMGDDQDVPLVNTSVSVTSDASDRIIMTWAGGDGDRPLSVFYALADSTGTFITNPMEYRFSAAGMLISTNGQGNAPILSEPPEFEVDIDIVPSSAANIINLKSISVPVAILSSAGFNALTDVDRSSLRFGKIGNESSFISCLKGGRDVNVDGRLDLVCNFRVRSTGLLVGDTVAILRGSTISGLAFEASNSVVVIKGTK